MSSHIPPIGRGQVIPPVMSREAWAAAIGLEIGVVNAQCDKGYWPLIRIGKYSLINAEAVRIAAAEKAKEFVL